MDPKSMMVSRSGRWLLLRCCPDTEFRLQVLFGDPGEVLQTHRVPAVGAVSVRILA